MPSLSSFPRHCPICETAQNTPLEEYSVTEWPVVSCACCEFVYLARGVDYSALKQDHAWEKSTKQETRRRRKHLLYRLDQATRFRVRFGINADRRWVMSAVREPGNVLDIGCGTQCRLAEGVVPFGIEISEALARQSDPIYRARGGRVVNAPAHEGLDQFEDGFFSAVIMRSYLEHEARPRTVIAKVHRKLRPGGIALVKVPDFDCIGRRIMGVKWCGFRFPDHLNYFTEGTLRLLAVANGFRFKRQNLIPRVNDNLYAVLTRVRSAAQPIIVAYHVAFEGVFA
jgi:SAM-dependent methyltransferase